MKAGALLCVLIAGGWVLLALAQLWLLIVTAEVFIKLTISAGLLFVLVLCVSLAVREYATEKRQKDQGYID
jgi:hypothetical protein